MKNRFDNITALSHHITKLTNLLGLEINYIRAEFNNKYWLSLSVLTKLQHLRVIRNDDSIPLELYASLRLLTQLQSIRVATSTKLTVLQQLSKLNDLELIIRGNILQLSDIPSTYPLTSLEIEINGHKPSVNLSDLKRFTALQHFVYEDKKSTYSMPVGELTSLRSLGLTVQDVDKYPTNLTWLSVANVPEYQLTKLRNLKFLRILHLQDKNILSFIQSTNIEELYIINEELQFSSEDLWPLTQLHSLKNLELKGINCSSGQYLSAILSQLTNLTRLSLSQFDDELGIELEISSYLCQLEAIETKGIGDVIFTDAEKLTALTSLTVTNSCYDTLSYWATRLQSLGELAVDDPDIVMALALMTNLTHLECTSVPHQLFYQVLPNIMSLNSLQFVIDTLLDFETLTTLSKLTALFVHDAISYDPLQNLTKLTSLQYISLLLDKQDKTSPPFTEQEFKSVMPYLCEIDISRY